MAPGGDNLLRGSSSPSARGRPHSDMSDLVGHSLERVIKSFYVSLEPQVGRKARKV